MKTSENNKKVIVQIPIKREVFNSLLVFGVNGVQR
jgi:hypothetical protein